MTFPGRALFTSVVFLALLILFSSSAFARTALKFATLAPKGIGWATGVEKFLEPWIKDSSNGDYVVKVYWGGVMGNDDDYLRKMRIGQLDGAGCTAVGANLACPEFSVVGLPFLFNNYDEVDYIRESMFSTFDFFFSENGYKLMLWIDQDFDQFFSSKYRFNKLEDFKKAQIVTWFGPQEEVMLKALGASPIPMDVTEVPAARRQGIVDTNIAPSIWEVGSQLYTVDKFVNTMKIRYSPAVIMVSNSVWADVPDEYKNTLMSTREETQAAFCDQVRKDNAKCLDAMIGYGVKHVDVTPAELATIRDRAMEVYRNLSGDLYPQELLSEVRRYLAAYRGSDQGTAVAAAPSRPAPSSGGTDHLQQVATARSQADKAREAAASSSSAQVASSSTPSPAPRRNAWAERKRQISEVQKVLNAQGLYNYTIDGIYGPITRGGIIEYQKRHGLPPTGAVDRRLMQHMGIQ